MPKRKSQKNLSVKTLNRLRAGVLGANDGIVSTSSILMGVVGANANTSAVFTAGLAALVAGALSMAVGEYVSVASQLDAEKAHAEKNNDDDVEFTSPIQAGAASLGFFTIGGLIPFIAVLISSHDATPFAIVFSVLVALVATGFFSATIAKSSKLKAIIRIVIGGLIAMIVTYYIGKLFGTYS